MAQSPLRAAGSFALGFSSLADTLRHPPPPVWNHNHGFTFSFPLPPPCSPPCQDNWRPQRPLAAQGPEKMRFSLKKKKKKKGGCALIAAKSLFVRGCTDSQLVTEKDQDRERGSRWYDVVVRGDFWRIRWCSHSFGREHTFIIAPFVPILMDGECTPQCLLISLLKTQPRTFDFIATAELII